MIHSYLIVLTINFYSLTIQGAAAKKKVNAYSKCKLCMRFHTNARMYVRVHTTKNPSKHVNLLRTIHEVSLQIHIFRNMNIKRWNISIKLMLKCWPVSLILGCLWRLGLGWRQATPLCRVGWRSRDAEHLLIMEVTKAEWSGKKGTVQVKLFCFTIFFYFSLGAPEQQFGNYMAVSIYIIC